jgi:hypothetical protein
VSNIQVWISVDSAWLRLRQAIALPVYKAALFPGCLRATLRRLSELAVGLALVASFVLVMLIRLVIRDFPDMDGIDG